MTVNRERRKEIGQKENCPLVFLAVDSQSLPSRCFETLLVTRPLFPIKKHIQSAVKWFDYGASHFWSSFQWSWPQRRQWWGLWILRKASLWRQRRCSMMVLCVYYGWFTRGSLEHPSIMDEDRCEAMRIFEADTQNPFTFQNSGWPLGARILGNFTQTRPQFDRYLKQEKRRHCNLPWECFHLWTPWLPSGETFQFTVPHFQSSFWPE